MGSNTLNNRSSGQTILDTFFNDIHSALDGDFVGRGATGIPTSGQNLGTVSIPWGTVNAGALVLNGAAIDTSQITSPVNRLISGKKRTTSNQPAFITPNGAAASFILAGATTSLVYDVNGTRYAFSTDATKSGLTVAPSTNNTAVVSDAAAAATADTRRWGEPKNRKKITIGTVGSNISSKVGTWQAFKVVHSAVTEYFYAYIDSTTSLSKCYRGYFYDSTLTPVNRGLLSNGDTITLLNTGYVFVDADQTTIDVSYNNPKWSFVSPSSPATGDYWYDLGNKLWKRYDGSSFQIVSRVFIGMVVLDSTNCVAARCNDFYSNYQDTCNISVEVNSTSVIQGAEAFQYVSVMGNKINFDRFLSTWNITTDLAGSADMYSATEQASTMYYLYVKDDGRCIISDIEPYNRGDLRGMYHPHNPWRCVAMAWNDGSSNLVNASHYQKYNQEKVINDIHLSSSNGFGSTATSTRRYSTVDNNLGCNVLYVDSTTLGAQFICYEEGTYEWAIYDQHNGGNSSTAVNCVLNGTSILQGRHGQLSSGDVTSPTATVSRHLNIGDIATVTFGGAGSSGTAMISRLR